MLLDLIFYILGVFRGNPKQVKEYQDLLTPVLHQTTEGIVGLFFQEILPTNISLTLLGNALNDSFLNVVIYVKVKKKK